MYRVELKKVIKHLMALFYYLGVWHRGNDATVRETRIKLFYSFIYVLWPTSLMAGAIISDDRDDAIFLSQSSIMSTILSVIGFFLIWKKNQIIEMLNECCVYTVEDRNDFNQVDNLLQKFERLIVAFVFATTFTTVSVIGWPFLCDEKQLFFNIAFPLDWKNNEIAYWIVNAYVLTAGILCITAFFVSVLIWYAMINCALRYKVLGNQIRNMGAVKMVVVEGNERNISEKEKQNIFQRDLIAAIETHQQIREYETWRSDFRLRFKFFISVS